MITQGYILVQFNSIERTNHGRERTCLFQLNDVTH